MLPPDERPGQGHRHPTVTTLRAKGSQYTNNRGNHGSRDSRDGRDSRDDRDRHGNYDRHSNRGGCDEREGLSEYCEPLARFFAL